MIKISEMTDRVQHGEEERGACHDLVEDNVGVQGNVLVKCPLFHLCNQISKKTNSFNMKKFPIRSI